jgi:Ca-activated chloride channel family protein
MKPQQNQGGQQSGEQQGQQQGAKQQSAKQQSAKNGQQQGGEQQSEGQEGQSGDQSQQAQEQQGKGQGNSDSKQASKQPGSGVGSQDGDKKLKNAEQLAAMGKISEIIGKRSQTISGETTVEVQQTQQTLRTQYSNRAVQHTQAASEIGRDEIPVALQSFVESYFEAVRKAAPKK